MKTRWTTYWISFLVLCLAVDSFAGPLPNDSCADAFDLEIPSTLFGTTETALTDNAPACSRNPRNVAGVWYKVVGTGETLLAKVGHATHSATTLNVYSGTCDSLRCVLENAPCDLQSSLAWFTEPGTEYFIWVFGSNPDSGPFELDVTVLPESFLRGDSNGDGTLNITDVILVVTNLFQVGLSVTCDDAADTNDDGSVNTSDIVFLLSYLFRGGLDPPAPHPECGTDPTDHGDVGCETSPACSPGLPLVVRGPQVALAAETSLVVAWLSDEPTVGAVAYTPIGPKSLLTQETADTVAAKEHVIELDGLVPDTTYHYQLLHDGTPVSERHSFVTPPKSPSAPLRCAVFGDSGSGTIDQLTVADQVAASNPDLVLISGDVIYPTATRCQLDSRYFVPYANLIDHIPFYPALGNHDVGADGGQHLLDALYLPENDANHTEEFYSFDRTNVHLVALNTLDRTEPGSPQYTWLEGDLERSSAPWTFAYFHFPPYSSSAHGSNLRVRDDLAPLFDRFGVDLVFSGHDHTYERTLPLRGQQVVDSACEPDYVDPGGTVYIVTGGGGRRLYGSGTSYFTAYSESAHHFVQVDVDQSSVNVTAIRSDGTVMDRMTITKTPR